MITATYRCSVGKRAVNVLMRHFDLGVTGAFETKRATVSWKPDEHVDRERALAFCETLKAAINDQPEFECAGVELIEFQGEK